MRSPIKNKWLVVMALCLSLFAAVGLCKNNKCAVDSKTAINFAQLLLFSGVAVALASRARQYQPHRQSLSTQDAEILRILSGGELVTVEVYHRLQQLGIAPSSSGDLPPLLARLEGMKLLASRWDKSVDESGMRLKYYRTTSSGSNLLRSLVQQKSAKRSQ